MLLHDLQFAESSGVFCVAQDTFVKPEPIAGHHANGVQPDAVPDGRPNGTTAPSATEADAHAASHGPGADSKPAPNGGPAAADPATNPVKPEGACALRE